MSNPALYDNPRPALPEIDTPDDQFRSSNVQVISNATRILQPVATSHDPTQDGGFTQPLSSNLEPLGSWNTLLNFDQSFSSDHGQAAVGPNLNPDLFNNVSNITLLDIIHTVTKPRID